MANVIGGDRARTGPYWRRQMGTTMPGEMTGAQLHDINELRRRMGVPPLGGPGPGRQAMPGQDMGRPYMPQPPMRHITGVGGPTFGQGMDEFGGGVNPMERDLAQNPDMAGGEAGQYANARMLLQKLMQRGMFQGGGMQRIANPLMLRQAMQARHMASPAGRMQMHNAQRRAYPA